MKSKNRGTVITLSRGNMKAKETPPSIEKRYNKVYVVASNGYPDESVKRLFREEKYLVVNDFNNADIVVFTGGSDVSPYLYGQPRHPTTHSNKVRDDYEVSVYNSALKENKFMVGICRGGQFLNVMNGGTLWQDVDGHAIGGLHTAYSMVEDLPMPIEVTSTHHQMIRPREATARVLLTAYESSRKEDCYYFKEEASSEPKEMRRVVIARKGTAPEDIKYNKEFFEDIESCYYAGTKSFCFQPHPEYGHAPNDCVMWFFDVLEMLIAEAYNLKSNPLKMRTNAAEKVN